MSAAVSGLNASIVDFDVGALCGVGAVAAEERPRPVGRASNAASKEQSIRIQNAREEVRNRNDVGPALQTRLAPCCIVRAVGQLRRLQSRQAVGARLGRKVSYVFAAVDEDSGELVRAMSYCGGKCGASLLQAVEDVLPSLRDTVVDLAARQLRVDSELRTSRPPVASQVL